MEPKVGDKLICKMIPRWADTGNPGSFTLNKTYVVRIADLWSVGDIHIVCDDGSSWVFYLEKSNKYYIFHYFVDVKKERKQKLEVLWNQR